MEEMQMTKRTVQKIAESLERRNFLKKLTLVTGAFLGGVLGLSQPAHATTRVFCCFLCKDPKDCTYKKENCACEWSWTCDHRDSCATYLCKECHTVTPCGASCGTTAICSAATFKRKIKGCTPK